MTASLMLTVLFSASWASAQDAPKKKSPLYAMLTSTDAIELDSNKVVGGVSHESGVRLMDPVTFDFNGDGIDDIAFGAPGMSMQGVPNAGAVFVLLGKKEDELAGRIDMTLWRSFDYRFDGVTTNGQLGMNLVAGDFNGDGVKDIAVAEPGATGRVYVIYGGKKLNRGHYQIIDERISDVYFGGGDNDANFGIQMCIGDFNTDDIDDLAVSYVTANKASNTTSTTTNVVLLTMRSHWDSRYHSITSNLYGKTTFSRAVGKGVNALYTCAAGDFNDDGLMDIALGMPLDTIDGQKATGSVTIVNNPFKYSGTTLNLGENKPDWGFKISGSQTGALFGYSLASGDFTGDGRTDLAVGAPNRLIKGPDREGAVFILDASKWPTQNQPVMQPEDLRIDGQSGQFGFKVEAQDANRDNRPDIVVSAPYANAMGATAAGSLSVYLGGPHFVESVQNQMRADIQVSGDQDMLLGFGAAFGDFNGDSKNDVIIRTAADPDGRPNTGAYILVPDAQQMTPDVHLDKVKFRTVVAPSRGGGLEPNVRKVTYDQKEYYLWLSQGGLGGRSVICLNDVNDKEREGKLYVSDSCNINIIGPENAPISDAIVSSTSDGKSWLTIAIPTFPLKKSDGVVATIELPSNINKPLTLNLSESTLASEAISFTLNDEYESSFGAKIGWEDLDDDGKPDLIIGAPDRLIDQTRAGSAFVIKDVLSRKKGKYDLVTDPDVITFEGFDDENFGADWQVLDFNLDGKKDLAILAENTRNTLLEVYSTVYVVYSIGDREVKNYNITSPEIAPLKVVAPMHRAGLTFVKQHVDLNNDGNDDLVMLSPNYRAGLQRQGAVLALFSSAERRSGTHSLANDALTDFSLISNRSEKISDALFVRHGGDLQLLVLTDSLLTRQSTLKRYISTEPNVFSGRSNSSTLKRIASDVPMNENAQLLMINDAEHKEDLLWLLFPNAGESQSDQGIAHPMRLK